jgi:hypothetical protein
MAEKRTVELEIKDNSKSLKSQYKEAVAELQKVSAQYGETSKEAINAAKSAALLKDQIAESKDLVNAFNPDAKFKSLEGAISGVLNGFQAYEGAMGLIGAENEELQKTMLKVQSAMALTQGINGVMEAGDAFKKLGAKIKDTAIGQGLLTAATAAYTFVTTATTTAVKLFRIALISTGIGALIVGVGLLVANFDSIVNVVKKVVGWFSGLSGTMKNVISVMFPIIGIIRLVVAGLEALGVVENEAEKKQRIIDEATIKRHHKRMDEIAKEKALREKLHKTMEEAYNKQDKAAAREIALLKAQGKDTTALERARLQATINYQTNLQNESAAIYNQNKAKHELTKAELYAIGVRADDFKEYNKYLTDYTSRQNDLLADNKAANEARKDAVNQLAIFEIEVRKRNAESQSNSNQSSINSENKTAQTKIDITRRLEDESLRIKDEGRQKELDALDLQYKRKKEDAEKELKDDKNKVSKLAALNAQAIESKKIDEKTINDKYDKLEKEAAAKALEDKIKLQDEQWYALQKLKNSQQEQELLDLQIAYDKEFEAALNNTVLQKELTDKFNKDSAAINKKYTDEKAAADKLAADAEIELAKKTREQKQAVIRKGIEMSIAAFSVINDLFQMNAAKSEKDARKQFKIQKAFNLASAIANTYLAVTGALTAGGNPIKLATGAQFVEAGIAAAVGGVNIAKISATQFDSKSFSKDSGNSGGGGGNEQMVPQFNTVGNNGINQLAQLQQQPTMAYVVSGQVTSQQALDRNRAQNSSL